MKDMKITALPNVRSTTVHDFFDKDPMILKVRKRFCING